VLGVILVSAAATLGASLSFLISRYFARDATARWLSSKEKFRRLDQLTEDHGATIVALTRLVPIFPFNLLNYGFGLTRVHFWTYVFWSWLCMLPGTILYVVGADALIKGIAQGRIPWVLVGAVAVAGIVLAILVRYARRRLQSKEAKADAGADSRMEDRRHEPDAGSDTGSFNPTTTVTNTGNSAIDLALSGTDLCTDSATVAEFDVLVKDSIVESPAAICVASPFNH